MQLFFFLFASSNTSLATSTLSKISLPARNADCLESMILLITFLSFKESNFDMILYEHPTKEIGMKLHRFCGFSDLGTKHTNDAFVPLGHFPNLAKSFTAKRISSLKNSQQNLMSPKLKPSGLELKDTLSSLT